MNRIDQLTITSDHLREASQLARSCVTSGTRTRVLVTRAAMLAIREYLEDYYGLQTGDGRAMRPEFAELLDLADFEAGDWRVELRLIADQDDQRLQVPTMPLLVGATADIYLAIALDRRLSRVELLGFARQSDLATAELSENGLFAILPRTSLRPAVSLIELLAGPRPIDDWRIDFTETWQQDALRLVDHLACLIEQGSGSELNGDEILRVVEVVRDEVWRIYGDRMPATGLTPLLKRLFTQFGLATPVPTLCDDPLLFRNSVEERRVVSRQDIQEAFLRDQLHPGERIALYRHLLEDRAAFAQFRQRRRVLDHLTQGRHQAPAAQLTRQEHRQARDEDQLESVTARHPELVDTPQTPIPDDGVAQPVLTVLPDAAAQIDLELFEDQYHQILTSLQAWFPGLQIEPGGDVIEHGRVIGSYFAQMELNGIPIRLVDVAKPRSQQVRETLASEMDVLSLDLDRRDQSLELIRLAFQC